MRRSRAVWVGSIFLAISMLVPVAVPPLRHPLTIGRLLLSSAAESLQVPVDGVKVRQITDSWGAPRSGGRRHEGVDIFAPRATPVRSTTPGIVILAGTIRLGGNAVIVLGPAGRLHYYAHLDSFGAFRTGKKVNRGDIIGYVGNTGNAKGTPCHLHYGIYRLPWNPMNPQPLLSDN